MAEYITKEQVIEWFRPYGHTDEGIPYYGLVTDIRGMKAADVAPVVHGHFVHDGPRFAGGVDWWHCSNCGGLLSGVETQFEYCPHCGAKMDGGAENG